MCSPEMRQRAGRLGGDGTLAHANNGHGEVKKDTEDTKKTSNCQRHRGPKAWISPEAPKCIGKSSSRAGQSLSLLSATPGRDSGRQLELLAWGRGDRNSLGERARISPPSYGDGPLLPEIQALSFQEGPGHPCGTQETVSGCIQGKSIS